MLSESARQVKGRKTGESEYIPEQPTERKSAALFSRLGRVRPLQRADEGAYAPNRGGTAK